MTPSSLTSSQVKQWRLGHGWSRSFAADVIGISYSSISDYERGKRVDNGKPAKVPKVVALAMAAIDAGLKPYSGVTK